MDLIHLDSKLKRLPVRLLQSTVSALLSSEIKSGPFTGLRVHKNNFGSALLPKLLGTYERELADRFYKIITDESTDAFVDVGCAGGYYLHLASQLRNDIQLIGIDYNRNALAATARALRESRQLQLRCERASGPVVAATLAKFRNPTLMIDIEGGETKLFDELRSEELSHATVFLEVHEFAGASLMQLERFFSPTHRVEAISFARYRSGECDTAPTLGRLLTTHELRHPNTSYMIAYPRGNS